jgi:hypothetical protein
MPRRVVFVEVQFPSLLCAYAAREEVEETPTGSRRGARCSFSLCLLRSAARANSIQDTTVLFPTSRSADRPEHERHPIGRCLIQSEGRPAGKLTTHVSTENDRGMWVPDDRQVEMN